MTQESEHLFCDLMVELYVVFELNLLSNSTLRVVSTSLSFGYNDSEWLIVTFLLYRTPSFNISLRKPRNEGFVYQKTLLV